MTETEQPQLLPSAFLSRRGFIQLGLAALGAAWTGTLKKAARVANDDNMLGFIAYVHNEMENQEDFFEKQRAVRHLVQSVRQIGESHAELEQSSSELNGEKVKALVGKFKDQVFPVIKEVQDAF